MADPVSICQSIGSLIVKVKGILDKFRTNKKDCNRILTLVDITQAVVEPLKQGQPDILNNKGLSAALGGLEKALQCALEVVRKCQEKSTARGLLEADAISMELLEVYNEIGRYVGMVTLATSINNGSMLTNITEKQDDLRISDARPDSQQQVQKSVQTRRSSTGHPIDENKQRMGTNKTDVAGRSEEKDEKHNAPPADIKTPWASLSSDAKSTSVKSVPGQGHPHIVTKMISSSTRSMTGVTSIDMHPTEPWIVTGDMGGNVCIWNYQKQETVMKKLVTKERMIINEKAAKHRVCSVKFITKKNWLVVGDGRGYIHVYDYTNTKLPEVKKFKSPDGNSVDLLAVHPTKTFLLSSSAYGNKIILWDWSGVDWNNNHEFDIKSTYQDGVLSLKFNPRHSNTFACVTNDKRLMVGNIKFHTLTTKQKGLSEAEYFFDHYDQHLMVTLSISSHDAEIRNLETGKVVAPLCVSGRRTRLVVGHPTLPILVTALDDGTVCFWDSSTGTYRLEKKVTRVTDEPADDLTLVDYDNGITRLAVTSESTIAIMEVSYSPTASTSRPPNG